jgi:hypothetical protein
MSIEKAILETLIYSDIYDYPLNIDELHLFLVTAASRDDVLRSVEKMREVGKSEGYYFLSGRDEIVGIRRARQAASHRPFRRALRYGNILGHLPFVRMTALTGSLAVKNPSTGADMDYMLVTHAGRLWTARAFAVTFGRLIRLFGDRICVNLLVSEKTLSWPMRDLYSAREFCQMILITGADVYQQVRDANAWTESILPNFSGVINRHISLFQNAALWFQRILEIPFNGRAGDRLEQWARNYQLRHISRKYGEGDESSFSADLCQTNFHNHRQQAGEHFQARLSSLGLAETAQTLSDAYILQ